MSTTPPRPPTPPSHTSTQTSSPPMKSEAHQIILDLFDMKEDSMPSEFYSMTEFTAKHRRLIFPCLFILILILLFIGALILPCLFILILVFLLIGSLSLSLAKPNQDPTDSAPVVSINGKTIPSRNNSENSSFPLPPAKTEVSINGP